MRARVTAALGTLILVTGCEGAQKANEPSLPPPRIISGAVSVAAACARESASEIRPAEPSLAADPNDPRQVIASWLENPSGTVVAVSHDGGGTWSRSPLPGLLTCAGGRYARTRDPRGSIRQDGVIFFSGFRIPPSPPGGNGYQNRRTASRGHWNPP